VINLKKTADDYPKNGTKEKNKINGMGFALIK
jgi:hypothetical protein